MSAAAPVLLIGLDAAEVTLVERLCAEGRMPALQALRERGCFGTLDADATMFAGGVWPTFYTAKPVAYHGIYHNKLWRHEQMRCEIAGADWLPEQPFWQRLGPDQRVAIIDVPMTVAAPHVANGVQIAGWGTHDLIAKGSWPAALWPQLERVVGTPTMPNELFGPQSVGTLLKLKETLLQATDQVASLSETLLQREAWDLFLVVFGAPHRGGHYLWDLSQIDPATLTESAREALEQALIEIYEACDRAIARLIAQAPANSRVVVFAVHGMGPNQSWADRCADLLACIQQREERRAPKTGLLYTLKRALPWQLVRQVTTRLPQSLINRLVTLWSANMFDWRTTRAFPLPMDHAGYLRVNLRGREPAGIVAPGAEYDALCDELAEAFGSFREATSGKPIVDRVYRLNELAPADAPFRDGLPDLLITWGDTSPIHGGGVRSERYGELDWQPHGRLPSGRAGNHRGQGWFVASGGDVPSVGSVVGHRTIDLAPTVLRWLGIEPPADMHGQAIAELFGTNSLAASSEAAAAR